MSRPDVFLSEPELLASCHAFSLGILRPVYDFKLDWLALVESSRTVPLNSRKINKNVTADFLFDKSIALGIIEPLDLPCDAHRISFAYLKDVQAAQIAESVSLVAAMDAQKKTANAAFKFLLYVRGPVVASLSVDVKKAIRRRLMFLQGSRSQLRRHLDQLLKPVEWERSHSPERRINR